MKNTKEKGNYFEATAAKYLLKHDYFLVDRNFYTKYGEIDIIALKNNVLHIIEVKGSKGSFNPVYNLSPTKLQRIIKSTYIYLGKKKLDYKFQIDLICVRNGHIEHLKNITA